MVVLVGGTGGGGVGADDSAFALFVVIICRP